MKKLKAYMKLTQVIKDRWYFLYIMYNLQFVMQKEKEWTKISDFAINVNKFLKGY